MIMLVLLKIMFCKRQSDNYMKHFSVSFLQRFVCLNIVFSRVSMDTNCRYDVIHIYWVSDLQFATSFLPFKIMDQKAHRENKYCIISCDVYTQ